METWNIDTIEAAFADAAVDPSAWRRALNVVTEQTEGFGAFLSPMPGKHLPNLPISDRMDRSFETYVRDGWYLRDERYRGVNVMVRDGVYDDRDFVDLETTRKMPYYQEFLAPAGLRWFAGIKVSSGDDLWCLSIQRGATQTPFSEEEKCALAKLSRCLSSAAAMSRALGFVASSAALDAFDLSGTAVVLLDRQRHVIRANASAERLLTGDVCISRRKLVAKDARATVALDRALHRLLWSRDGGALAAPIALPRRGQRPLLAHVLKLSSLTSNALADCQAAIVLVDPDRQWRPTETTLQAAFGLSVAEARLASRIASGHDLETISAQLGISKETSRSQLKAIFAKTGVQRQAELVALLARLMVS